MLPSSRASSAILACTAIGVSHAAIGITDRAMQMMVIRGLVARQGGRYVLTETGRAVFDVLLEARLGGMIGRDPGKRLRRHAARLGEGREGHPPLPVFVAGPQRVRGALEAAETTAL